MVWLSFVVCLVFGIVLLIVPGFLLTKLLGADRCVSAAFGPVASVALYNSLSVVFGALGVPCGLFSLVVLPVAVLACVYIATRARRAALCESLCMSPALSEKPFARISLSWAGLCALASVACTLFVASVFYVPYLGSPDNLMCAYDNAYHLTRLRSFAESCNYSSLAGGYYPSAWHCLGALIMSTMGCSATLAAQAASLSFVFCAYSLGMSVLLGTLFPDKRRRVLLGSLFCACTWFFPWEILLYGPLYPNMASFSLMPAALAVFLRMFRENTILRERISCAVLFVLSLTAFVFAQPNTIFFSGIFVVPFLMRRIRETFVRVIKRKGALAFGVAAEALFALLCVMIWVGALSLPFMQPLVNYERDVPLSFGGALTKLLTFQFVIWRPQYLLFILLLVGCLRTLTDHRGRWLVLSYGLIAFVYLASVSFSGQLRGYISGFCYNDYCRTAACVCIVCVPLVANGIDFCIGLVGLLARMVSKKFSRSDEKCIVLAFQGLSLIAIAAFNYFPLLVDWHFTSWGFDTVSFETEASYQHEDNIYYEPKERAFVDEVKRIVGNELVFNQPYDGSVFSYAVNGLNVVFPRYGFLEDGSDEYYLMINLCDVAKDDSVAAAVKRLGVRYVMQLDQGSSMTGMNKDGWTYDVGYEPKEWIGINSIRDDTPGFKLVLSEGDMRLYQIEL